MVGLSLAAITRNRTRSPADVLFVLDEFAALDRMPPIEKCFGPILPIVEVDTVKQAIELVNQGNMGLGASIWTGNKDHGEQVSKVEYSFWKEISVLCRP